MTDPYKVLPSFHLHPWLNIFLHIKLCGDLHGNKSHNGSCSTDSTVTHASRIREAGSFLWFQLHAWSNRTCCRVTQHAATVTILYHSAWSWIHWSNGTCLLWIHPSRSGVASWILTYRCGIVDTDVCRIHCSPPLTSHAKYTSHTCHIDKILDIFSGVRPHSTVHCKSGYIPRKHDVKTNPMLNYSVHCSSSLLSLHGTPPPLSHGFPVAMVTPCAWWKPVRLRGVPDQGVYWLGVPNDTPATSYLVSSRWHWLVRGVWSVKREYLIFQLLSVHACTHTVTRLGWGLGWEEVKGGGARSQGWCPSDQTPVLGISPKVKCMEFAKESKKYG